MIISYLLYLYVPFEFLLYSEIINENQTLENVGANFNIPMRLSWTLWSSVIRRRSMHFVTTFRIRLVSDPHASISTVLG